MLRSNIELEPLILNNLILEINGGTMRKNIFQQVRLFISDYEGVWTPNRFLQPDAQALLAVPNFPNVLNLIKNGGFSFCTGRSASFLEGIFQLLGLIRVKMPCVVENGAAIYWPGENRIKYHPLIEKKLWEILEARISLWRFIDEKKLGQLESGKDICLSFNPVNGTPIRSLYETITEQVTLQKLNSLFEVTHSASAVDATPLGINKGSGAEWLFAEMGVSAESVGYMGDSRGDLPALEKVGIPICPQNADKEVKALVTRRNGIIARQSHVYGLIEVLCATGCIY